MRNLLPLLLFCKPFSGYGKKPNFCMKLTLNWLDGEARCCCSDVSMAALAPREDEEHEDEVNIEYGDIEELKFGW